MHLDTEQLERLLHGELDPAQEGLLRSHLRVCSYCAGRLEQAAEEERQVFAALRWLDHPVPEVSAEAITSRRSPGQVGLRRVAAGVVLVLAGTGALYAVPGSPLPGMLHEVLTGNAPAEPASPETSQAYSSGVAVAPGDDLDLVFASWQERGHATVRLVDAGELTIRALGEPVAFDVGIRRLTIANRDATADYEILIPRTAPSVRIHVGGTLIMRKDGERIYSPSAVDGTGVLRLPLRPPLP